MSLLAVEHQFRGVEMAVANAKLAIDGVRKQLQYYAEQPIDEGSLIVALQAMDLAIAELKNQSKAIKESEQYRLEYQESYIGAAVDRQEDLFNAQQPNPPSNR
jgi:hypothetical protein